MDNNLSAPPKTSAKILGTYTNNIVGNDLVVKNGTKVMYSYSNVANILTNPTITSILNTGRGGGSTGVRGPTGAQGATGPGGILGPPGDTGALSYGSTGIRGSTGVSVIGVQGPTGATGFGATGARGISGENGLQGTTGVRGATGVNGLAGSQGPTGVTIGGLGVTGATGINTILTKYTNARALSIVSMSNIISDSTFLPPSTTKYLRITNIGRGGNGGGAEPSGDTQCGGGGGGGGGGAVVIFTTPYIPMANVVYTSTLGQNSVITYASISSIAGYGRTGNSSTGIERNNNITNIGIGADGGLGGVGSCTLADSIVLNGCNGFAGGCYYDLQIPLNGQRPWNGGGIVGGIVDNGGIVNGIGVKSIGGGGMGGGSGFGSGGGGGGGLIGNNAGILNFGSLTGLPLYGGGGGGGGGDGLLNNTGNNPVSSPSTIGGASLLIVECIE